MLRIALRSLGSRKLRSALTALAIVLGTAMIAGTFVLTDQVTGAFDEIFEKANKGVDVVLSRKEAFHSEGTPVGPIPCAATAAITSLIDARVTFWISARGIVRWITATGWAGESRICGVSSMGRVSGRV